MRPGEDVTEVEIFGERYTLRASETPEYLNQVAEYVDGKFHEVAKESPALTPVKIAVLASLNIADDLFKKDEAKHRAEKELLARIEEIFGLLHRDGVTG